MALSNIEKHYNKHPEDLRLLRRHGIVEFETTMHHLRRFLKPGMQLLDIGAGTGRYTSALMAEGYDVKAVELVKRNIQVFLDREPTADVVQGDARNMPFIPTASADVTLLLGPLYHLIGDEEKLKALTEAKRVTKLFTEQTSSWVKYGKGYGNDAELLEAFNEAYANHNEHNPLASVGLCSDDILKTLPPALFISAGHDILYDQTAALVKRLQHLNMPVSYRIYPTATHLFITVAGQPTAFKNAVRDVCMFLNGSD